MISTGNNNNKSRCKLLYRCLYGTFLVQRNNAVISWTHRGPVMQISMAQCKNAHYNDVIMSTIASQITSLAIVYSIVYSGVDLSKHQSCASLAFVWGIHRGPVNSPHKWPVTRKMFPFDDAIMSPVRYHSRYCRLALRHRYVVVNLVIFGAGNGVVACFAPSYHLTNAEILSSGPLGTNNEIRIKIQPFHVRNYVWKWWPFRLGLNVLTLLIRHWPFCHFQWFRQFSRTSKSL